MKTTIKQLEYKQEIQMDYDNFPEIQKNTKIKILIADDDPGMRFLLTKTIKKWGYDVIVTDNGDDAWEALNEDKPARIAVLDWMMPGLDGLEICQNLQQNHNTPLIYTILITGKSKKEDLVFALDNGAHDFISKPVYPEELRARISVGRRLVEADDKIQHYAQKMKILATTDPLTGINNRRYFFKLAEIEMERSKRYNSVFSVLLIDIDKFKLVNDTYGHALGDRVLKSMTDSCESSLRTSDIFGRLGGEEFAIVLPETNACGAVFFAERLRKSVEKLKVPHLKNSFATITVSIGVTSYFPEDTNIEAIIHRSDVALYKAKNNGRNQVIFEDILI